MRSTSNRDYVIKVGSELFLSYGCACTSMDEVAKRSGVAKSNIYYHFKSKDELMLAILENAISSLQSLFHTHILAETGALLPRLERYIDVLIEGLVSHASTGGCPLLSLMIEVGKTNEQVRMRLTQFFQQQAQAFTELFEMGKDRGEIRSDLSAHALASLLVSWLEGSLMLASIQKNASSLQEERDVLLRMVKTWP